MDDVTLRELVDELPTQSLELFVQHYEAGEVGGYLGHAFPRATSICRGCWCPRAALGFAPRPTGMAVVGRRMSAKLSPVAMPDGHPAGVIEDMAAVRGLDTDALYSECVLAIAERDASLDDLPQPEREAVGAK